MRLNASCKMGVNRMSFIGRAWKANVNVWKRHLTLQSIFNRGECMMHLDKNADDHVVDQNVDRISREIAYVPLGGGIRSKRSSCMQFFFFFWMSTRHAYLRSRIYDNSSHVFSRTKGLGSWLMFSEDLEFLDLGSCFQRTKGFLGFRSCFQRTKGSGSWLMFSEA